MDTRHLDKMMEHRKRIAALKAKVGIWEAPARGWLTMEDIAKQLGVSVRAAQYQMKPWIEMGKIEVKTYRVQRAVNAHTIPHYKLDPEVAKAYGIR